MTMLQRKKPRCWAAILGDCDDIQTREHIISECLYPNKGITVQGFDWCKQTPQKRQIQTLKRKVLCKRHNELLGTEVDEAALLSANALGAAMDLLQLRNPLKLRRWRIKHFHTDLWKLERWCIKTLINLNLAGSGFAYDTDGVHTAMNPPEELVRAAFGKQQFSDAKGLYVVARLGSEMTITEGWLQIATNLSDDRLVGADFVLWGMPFYLNLLPTEPPVPRGTNLLRRNVKHWYQTRDDKQRLVRSHLLTFNYPTLQSAVIVSRQHCVQSSCRTGN